MTSPGTGRFVFETNIEQVRRVIEANLRALQSELGKGFAPKTAGGDFLKKLNDDIARTTERGARQLQELARAFDQAQRAAGQGGVVSRPGDGRSFSAQSTDIAKQTFDSLNRQIGAQLGQLPQELRGSTQAVRTALEGGLRSVSGELDRTFQEGRRQLAQQAQSLQQSARGTLGRTQGLAQQLDPLPAQVAATPALGRVDGAVALAEEERLNPTKAANEKVAKAQERTADTVDKLRRQQEKDGAELSRAINARIRYEERAARQAEREARQLRSQQERLGAQMARAIENEQQRFRSAQIEKDILTGQNQTRKINNNFAQQGEDFFQRRTGRKVEPGTTQFSNLQDAANRLDARARTEAANASNKLDQRQRAAQERRVNQLESDIRAGRATRLSDTTAERNGQFLSRITGEQLKGQREITDATLRSAKLAKTAEAARQQVAASLEIEKKVRQRQAIDTDPRTAQVGGQTVDRQSGRPIVDAPDPSRPNAIIDPSRVTRANKAVDQQISAAEKTARAEENRRLGLEQQARTQAILAQRQTALAARIGVDARRTSAFQGSVVTSNDEVYDGRGRQVVRQATPGAEPGTERVNPLAYKNAIDARNAALKREESAISKAAARQEAINAKQSAGLVDRFLGGVTSSANGQSSGFTGSLGGLAQSAGFLVKYQALNVVLQGATQAVQQLGVETLDFIDSQTKFNIILGEGNQIGQSYISTLSGISRQAGSNVGEALDTAARAVGAFAPPLDLNATEEASKSAAKNREEIGAEVANAASQLRTLTGKDLKDVTGDIIAVATAFDLVPDQLTQVNDAIVNATKNFGADIAQVSQGTANLALAGEQAGFTIDETANIIALASSKLDQSGQLTATRLAKVFSITGGAQGQNFIKGLNQQLSSTNTTDAEGQLIQVDVQAQGMEQLQQLALAYNALDTAQQSQLKNALGGNANTRELVAILQNVDEALAANKASAEGTGAAIDQFRQRLSDITGTITLIVGDLKRIGVAIGESGLLDVFGLTLIAIEPLLNALGQMLELYNQLPRELRSILAITLELIVAQKLLVGLAARGGAALIPGALGRRLEASNGPLAIARRAAEALPPTALGAATNVAAGRAAAVAAGNQAAIAGAANAAALTAASASAAGAIRAGGITVGAASRASLTAVAAGGRALAASLVQAAAAVRAAGLSGSLSFLGNAASRGGAAVASGVSRVRAAGAGVGAGGLAGIGAVGVFAIFETAQKVNSILEAAEKTTAKLGGETSASAEDLAQSAKDLRTSAKAARDASAGFFGTIFNALTGNQTGQAADAAEEEAGLRERAAEAIKAIQSEAARTRPGEELNLNLGSAELLAADLKLLDDSGRNATTQFEALLASLNDVAVGASGAATALSRTQTLLFGQTASTDIASKINGIAEDRANFQEDGNYSFLDFLNDPFDNGTKGERDADILRGADTSKIQADLQAQIDAFAGANGGTIPDELRPQLQELLFNQMMASIPDSKSLSEDVKAMLRQQVGASIQVSYRDLTTLGNDPKASLDAVLQQGPALAQASAQRLGRAASLAGGSGSLVGAQGAVDSLTRLREIAVAKDANPEQLEKLDDLLQEAQLALQGALQSQIDGLNALANSLLPFDRSGVIANDLQAVADKLDVETDLDKRNALEAQQNRLLVQQGQQSNADASAARAAARDPRAAVRAAADAVTDAEEQLALLEANSGAGEELSRAEADLTAKRIALTQAKIENFNSFRSSSVLLGDTLGALQAEYLNLLDLASNQIGVEQLATLRRAEETNVAFQQGRRERSNLQSVARIDPRDSVGNAAQGLTNARDRLQDLRTLTPGDLDGIARLEREVAEAEIAYWDARIVQANTIRSNGVSLNDEVGAAFVEYNNLLSTASNQIGAEREATLRQADAAFYDLEQQRRERNTAARRFQTDPRDTVGNARITMDDSWLALKDAERLTPGDTTTIAELQRTVAENQLAFAQAQRDLAESMARAGVGVGDALGSANVDMQVALRNLAESAPGTQGFYDAQLQVATAQRALAVEQNNRATAIDVANNFPGSNLDSARSTLASAQRALAIEKLGTTEYYQALAAVRQAQQAVADAERDAARDRFRLNIDMTDPVQQAQEELAAARARARQNAAAGAGADVRNADQVAVRNAGSAVDAAQFSQRLGDIQVAEQLGQISQAAYMEYLQSERSRLAAKLAAMSVTDQGYRQAKDQLNQIDLALKSAADSLQGQFNLGDIKLPTVYQVRRAIGERAGAIVQQIDSAADAAMQVFSDANSGGGAAAVRAQLDALQTDSAVSQLRALQDAINGVATAGTLGAPAPTTVAEATSPIGGVVTQSVAGATTVNNTTSVTISGADLQQVKALLTTLLGATTTSRTAVTASRKVY